MISDYGSGNLLEVFYGPWVPAYLEHGRRNLYCCPTKHFEEQILQIFWVGFGLGSERKKRQQDSLCIPQQRRTQDKDPQTGFLTPQNPYILEHPR